MAMTTSQQVPTCTTPTERIRRIPKMVSSFSRRFLIHTLIIIVYLDNIPKDPAAIKKMAFSREESQMLITENINGIPAKEIKLAKILMDKPAPHCSA